LLQLGPLSLHERLERADLADHLRILRRDAARGVEPVQDVVEALGAEDDVDRRVVAVGRVDGDEARRERDLRVLQVRPCNREVVAVLPLLELDLPEVPVGAVVRLDRSLELVVDRRDLVKNLLCLRLLRRDGAGVGGRRAGGDQSRTQCDDYAARLSFPRTNAGLQASVAGGAGRKGRVGTRSGG
jgi:hypothetical protein